jgi:hypothetical protein
VVTGIVVLLTLVALVLLGTGFVAVFHEDTMRPPGAYWSWAIVTVLVMAMLIDLPMWIRVVNFIILLGTAWLWTRDLKSKETAR